MSAPSTARGAEPDAGALAALTGRRPLQKAAAVDPVLGAASAPVDYRGTGGLPAGEPATPTSPSSVLADEPVGLPERKEKVGGFYGYKSDLDRIRAAWFHTQTCEDGDPSLSEFIVRACLDRAAEFEVRHNDGQPFPAVPAGKVRHSRRS